MGVRVHELNNLMEVDDEDLIGGCTSCRSRDRKRSDFFYQVCRPEGMRAIKFLW